MMGNNRRRTHLDQSYNQNTMGWVMLYFPDSQLRSLKASQNGADRVPRELNPLL
jgi:hypothetical protein